MQHDVTRSELNLIKGILGGIQPKAGSETLVDPTEAIESDGHSD